uniref:Uncharacterized protein n=1 Tax=Anguilla anguilla TaxID=7936 RepID=A0A0E9X0C5_ANGAN
MHRLSQTTPPTRRLISTQSFLLRQSDDLSKKYLKLETLMRVFTEEKQDKTYLTTPVGHQTFPLTFSEIFYKILLIHFGASNHSISHS